ncbi:MAG: hypothetical protein EP344_13240 [Bacteroidetes bacterium]|nr:MAG: hypothetical protein EP344_13240 [Bacteroidota bacterium]
MKSLSLLFLSVLVISTFGCSKSDDAEPTTQVTIKDFEGTWKATSATFTNNSNASESLEFIGAGGAIRYTMLSGGNTRTWVDFQNNPVEEYDAAVSVGSNSTLIFTPADTLRPVETFTYVLGNNTITLTNNNARFDFTLSGATPVAATSVVVFVPF